MVTRLAPTSLAIWIISFEVVPRTMESGRKKKKDRKGSALELSRVLLLRLDFERRDENSPSTSRTFFPANSKGMALSLRRTFFFLRDHEAKRAKTKVSSSSFLSSPSRSSSSSSSHEDGRKTHLICCPGMMKVLPTYLFLTNPSLYGISNF